MEMLHILTVTDEEALKSLEIYLTRFKLKELELTNLFFKALKVFSYYLNYSNSKVQIVLFGIWSFFRNQIQYQMVLRQTSRPTSESSSKELNLGSKLNQTWNRPD